MLKDKSVFVTGGSRGIGKFIAEACAEAGAKVTVGSRTKVDFLPHVPLDVTDAASIEAAVKRVGRIDVLISNAAQFAKGSVVDLPVEDWDRVIGANLRASFLLCKAVLPQMIERKDGDIVLVSSTSGKRGNAEASAYTASKHGLNGFAHALLYETRPHNVRVITVSPSAVDTPERGEMRDHRLQAGDVAASVVSALQLPQRALVRDIELWATNP